MSTLSLFLISKSLKNNNQLIKTAMVLIILSIASVSIADDKNKKSCNKTTKAAYKACNHAVKNDYWINIGNCNNLSTVKTGTNCITAAKFIQDEYKDLCDLQADGREAVCESIGQDPYDPVIDPTQFVDPTKIGGSVAPNTYFPLIANTTRIYQSGSEKITVVVTSQTKVIMGVTCRVITDVVEENGEFVEVTEDWYAQDLDGNIWYFGEISKNFENGELNNLAGSWKAGVNGAKAGIIMKASLQVGEVYRQEFSLANAEDMAEILSTNGSASTLV